MGGLQLQIDRLNDVVEGLVNGILAVSSLVLATITTAGGRTSASANLFAQTSWRCSWQRRLRGRHGAGRDSGVNHS